MKYLFLGLLLLALLPAFCLWSDRALTGKLKTVSAPLEQAVLAVENSSPALAKRCCAEASAAWNACYPGLAAFYDHKSIDDLTQAFAGLADRPELPQLKTLLAMLQELTEADRLTLQNLL